MTMLVVTHEMGFARSGRPTGVHGWWRGRRKRQSAWVLADPQHERTKGFLSKAALGRAYDRHECRGAGAAAQSSPRPRGCKLPLLCLLWSSLVPSGYR